ncbi:MAG: FAD-binding domain-containing protein, partial [Cyanobacteria bacterium J06638_6]
HGGPGREDRRGGETPLGESRHEQHAGREYDRDEGRVLARHAAPGQQPGEQHGTAGRRASPAGLDRESHGEERQQQIAGQPPLGVRNRGDNVRPRQRQPDQHGQPSGHRADAKPIPPASTAAARELLQQFLAHKADRYYWQLSYPSAEATTGLSPHIKFGVISVRECVQTIRSTPDDGDKRLRRSHQQLISRLRWGNGFTQRFRYLPQLELRSLYRVFDDDGWAFDPDLYHAWQTGQTGFPIVDAAARCLMATGGYLALNFRTRAIYASFLSNLGGIDWRYGALHFMRHLIDGDCPIDHYQWAMQSGVTHCIDKSWTRIYNPGQVAIDRCDPEGAFIKRWVPELADVPPEQLGNPPTLSGYPAPILNYKTARQRRVKQLETQRIGFLKTPNLLPFLAPMPQDMTPFGTELYGGDVAWAQASTETLFPPPLPLDDLDPAAAQALRTWFVAHVNVLPPKSKRRRPQSPTPDPNVQQLSLLGDLGLDGG